MHRGRGGGGFRITMSCGLLVLYGILVMVVILAQRAIHKIND